jgi:hypothetical protein
MIPGYHREIEFVICPKAECNCFAEQKLQCPHSYAHSAQNNCAGRCHKLEDYVACVAASDAQIVLTRLTGKI